MTIESLLTRPVSTLSSTATCAEAARRMRRENIGSVIIEKDGTPIGIVTDRDLAIRIVAEELDASATTVDRVMSTFPAFLAPRRHLSEALDIMVQMGVRRLPAVNAKGHLIGILTLDDVLIEFAKQLDKVKAVLDAERGNTDVDNCVAG